MVPVVSLSSEAGEDNIVNIFERINRTGISLSLFDLAEARLYLKLKDAGLRGLRRLLEDFAQAHPDIAEVTKPEFLLKMIALFRGKEPRKGNLLDVLDDLEAHAFHSLWSEAVEAIILAYRRITQHYGASKKDWIPYTTIIVPLAALLHELTIRSAAEEAYRKVDRWYWASVLSQRYDSAVDTKTYRDVQDVRRWIDDDSAPEWLERLTAQDIDIDVDEPRSALYRGLLCLIAKRGARDFLTGQPALLHECQDDHIFPQALYGRSYPVHTILNRTLISKATNNKKRDKKPSEFLVQCLAGHGQDEARLLETLGSHFISPEAYDALQRNDFNAFVEARRKALSQAVQDLLRGTGP